jgi:hypothetical protein
MPRLRLRASGEPMTSNLTESDAARLAVVQLDALAVDLRRHGFQAVTSHEAGTLKLEVFNEAGPSCREDITVAADDNGVWWFLWSWSDRIALIGDVAAATFKIAYVLTLQVGG